MANPILIVRGGASSSTGTPADSTYGPMAAGNSGVSVSRSDNSAYLAAAVNKALAAAAVRTAAQDYHPAVTVTLPAGTTTVYEPLRVPAGVHLRGAGGAHDSVLKMHVSCRHTAILLGYPLDMGLVDADRPSLASWFDSSATATPRWGWSCAGGKSLTAIGTEFGLGRYSGGVFSWWVTHDTVTVAFAVYVDPAKPTTHAEVANHQIAGCGKFDANTARPFVYSFASDGASIECRYDVAASTREPDGGSTLLRIPLGGVTSGVIKVIHQINLAAGRQTAWVNNAKVAATGTVASGTTFRKNLDYPWNFATAGTGGPGTTPAPIALGAYSVILGEEFDVSGSAGSAPTRVDGTAHNDLKTFFYPSHPNRVAFIPFTDPVGQWYLSITGSTGKPHTLLPVKPGLGGGEGCTMARVQAYSDGTAVATFNTLNNPSIRHCYLKGAAGYGLGTVTDKVQYPLAVEHCRIEGAVGVQAYDLVFGSRIAYCDFAQGHSAIVARGCDMLIGPNTFTTFGSDFNDVITILPGQQGPGIYQLTGLRADNEGAPPAECVLKIWSDPTQDMLVTVDGFSAARVSSAAVERPFVTLFDSGTGTAPAVFSARALWAGKVTSAGVSQGYGCSKTVRADGSRWTYSVADSLTRPHYADGAGAT